MLNLPLSSDDITMNLTCVWFELVLGKKKLQRFKKETSSWFGEIAADRARKLHKHSISLANNIENKLRVWTMQLNTSILNPLPSVYIVVDDAEQPLNATKLQLHNMTIVIQLENLPGS